MNRPASFWGAVACAVLGWTSALGARADEALPTAQPSGEHAAAPTLPARLAFDIEGEALTRNAWADRGTVRLQSMREYGSAWSGAAQLRWLPHDAGARLVVNLDVPRAARYRFSLAYAKGPDNADLQVWRDGAPLGDVLHGYAERIEHGGLHVLGECDLERGTHVFEVRVEGRRPESRGYRVGLDRFHVEVLQVREPPASHEANAEEAVGVAPLPAGNADDLAAREDPLGDQVPALPAVEPGVAEPSSGPDPDQAANDALPSGPLPGEGDISWPAAAPCPDTIPDLPWSEGAPSGNAAASEATAEPPVEEWSDAAPAPLPPTADDLVVWRQLSAALARFDRWLAAAPGGQAWRTGLRLRTTMRAALRGPRNEAALADIVAFAARLAAIPPAPAYRELLSSPPYKQLEESLEPFR